MSTKAQKAAELAERMAAAARRDADKAPPLTQAQRDRLREIFAAIPAQRR